MGEGPIELLFMPSIGECIDLRWDWQPYATFLHRLASFTRIIAFDRRGVGASDPLPLDAAPSWERWVEDATAVLDEVGATRVAVFAWADGGLTGILFAATQPARTQAQEAQPLGHGRRPLVTSRVGSARTTSSTQRM